MEIKTNLTHNVDSTGHVISILHDGWSCNIKTTYQPILAVTDPWICSGMSFDAHPHFTLGIPFLVLGFGDPRFGLGIPELVLGFILRPSPFRFGDPHFGMGIWWSLFWFVDPKIGSGIPKSVRGFLQRASPFWFGDPRTNSGIPKPIWGSPN